MDVPEGNRGSFLQAKIVHNWLRLSDQNITFFIRIAAGRRSYNSIRSLLLASGILITDPTQLSMIALDHFTQILAHAFLPMLVSSLQWFLELISFRCSDHHKNILAYVPTAAEIEKTILKINPNKSPGPDGFTYAFFKSSWRIVGSETVAATQKFFATAFLPASTNVTILTLVLKRPGAASITD